MRDTIKKLTIEGFKSIRKLEGFELRSLNVLIGANGAGKSNFIGFFRLLRELIEQRLQVALQTFQGEFVTNYPLLMAGLTITALPIILVYLFMQKYIIKGVTQGAVVG